MTGNVTEITDPAGVRTCYEYDILGRKSRIYGDHGLEVRYGYDCMNRLKDIRYGNGVATSYVYDGDGNLEKLETKAGENVLMSFTYQYDGNGNRTAKIGMQRMAAGAENMDAGSCALDISYRYDIRGRLLEEKRNGESTHYAYDRAGNRTEKKGSKGKILYFYNEKNQLAGMEDAEKSEKRCFIYDRQGGIIEEKAKEGVRRFVYNSRHQQIRVEKQDGSGQTLRVQENRYDAEGLRFELIEDGKRTRFAYHDGELLYEEGGDGQDCQYQTSYHLGTGIDAAQRGKELSYYHRDEQLSTAFLTGSNGDVQNGYLYDAFGMGLEEQEKFPNRIRYTGQQYDGLTGQYYLRARYYNPVYGRFMQEDVYQGDGLNLYAYCDSNPVVYYDPSGYNMVVAGCGNATTGNTDDQTANTRTEQTTQGNVEGGSGIKYSPVNPGPLSEDVANSFNGATYTERVLTEDTVMYRVSGGKAEEVARYMSMTPQGGGLQSQLDLALIPEWGNTTENITKVVVPKGTTIYEGTVAPQNICDSLGNVIGTLPGGGNQVFIPTVEARWFQ